MSYLSKTQEILNKKWEGIEIRDDNGTKTCVVDGRLYADTKGDGIFHPVPLGMDDARDMKTHAVPDITVKDGVAEVVDDSKSTVRDGSDLLNELGIENDGQPDNSVEKEV